MEHQHSKGWYDRYYKLLLLIPIIVFIASLGYLIFLYSTTGDFISKDASLSGGTTITVQGEIDINSVETALRAQFGDVSIRQIRDLASGRIIATIIESSAQPQELTPAIEKVLGYPLTDENSSTEFSGPTLSNDFYRQLITAVVFSFILMSIVIFFLFRSFVPSMAVIFAAFADIVMALAFINLIGMKVSAAGIAAFLMLIGYSVDTDILLTTRVVKKKGGTVNSRIYGAFKTGMFMTVTGLAAVLPAFFIVTGLPDSFRQIFLILAVGLFADIFNTWLTNASMIKWYADKKGLD